MWPEGLSIKNRITMFLAQTPLDTQLVFGCPTANTNHYQRHILTNLMLIKVASRLLTTQPRYMVPDDLGSKLLQCSDKYQVSEADPLIMTQSWSWGSQIAVKKISNIIFFSRHQTMCVQIIF